MMARNIRNAAMLVVVLAGLATPAFAAPSQPTVQSLQQQPNPLMPVWKPSAQVLDMLKAIMAAEIEAQNRPAIDPENPLRQPRPRPVRDYGF